MIHSLFLGFKKLFTSSSLMIYIHFLLYKFYIHKFTTLELKKKKDKKCGEKKSKKINE